KALAVVGGLCIAVTFGALYNPEHYIYEQRLAHPFVGLLLGLTLFAAAARQGLTGWRAKTVYVLVPVVGPLSCALGAVGAAADASGSPRNAPVIATTADFKLVQYYYYDWGNEYVHLTVQSREGLLSREGTSIACVPASDSDVEDGLRFDNAAFGPA